MIKFFALITCLMVIVNNSFLNLTLGKLYFLPFILFLFVLVFFGHHLKIRFLNVAIFLIALLSVVYNEIPNFFRPWERFAVFLIVAGLVGPFFYNKSLLSFRENLFKYFNFSIIILVVLSAAGSIFQLPFFYGRSGFTGAFNHSMMMGPMAAIASINLFYYLQKTSGRKKYLLIACLGLSFLVCVAAGSRGAIIAGLAGVLFFLYKKNEKNISNFLRSLFLMAATLIVTFPLWESKTEFLQNKIAFSEQQGDFTASRNDLWEARIEEFQSSPIIGIGFASVDTTITDKYDKDTGNIEPGSSWLVVLSMIGFVGFLLIFLLISRSFLRIRKKDFSRIDASYFGALLIFFVLHMFSEGYIFSAGSGLFFYFWLLLGNIFPASYSTEFTQSLSISR